MVLVPQDQSIDAISDIYSFLNEILVFKVGLLEIYVFQLGLNKPFIKL